MKALLLPRKHIHRLRKELSEQIKTTEEVERFCIHANLPVHKINLRGAPWNIWGSVIGNVITNQEQALALLDNIIRDPHHNRNDIFLYYANEIRSSKNVRLGKLAEALKQRKCVVFLGPDVLKVRDGNSLITFNESLCSKLEQEMKNYTIYYDKNLNKNLAYLAQCYADDPAYAPGDIATQALELYNELLPRTIDRGIYEDLARLPLRLVINANTDDILFQQLKKAGIPCTADFYDISNYKATAVISQSASKLDATDQPAGAMVYNIFGSYQVPDSVLFTESQFLDFINRVLQGNPRLDPEVLRELNEKESYLFLGFDFEQWYFKILFQLLNIKKEQYASVSCGFEEIDADPIDGPVNAKVSVYNREFYEQEFKMFFVNDDIRNFISELATLLESDEQPPKP